MLTLDQMHPKEDKGAGLDIQKTEGGGMARIIKLNLNRNSHFKLGGVQQVTINKELVI